MRENFIVILFLRFLFIASLIASIPKTRVLAMSSTVQKVCVVCGLGKGGIGDSVAKKFAQEGYKVAMLARTSSTLEKLEGEIPNSKGYSCDATDSESVHTTVKQIISDMGGIDTLIYNVGVGYFKSFDSTTEEEFETCWKSGPKGLFSFAKAVTPHFKEKGGGVIGVTGATASWRGMPVTSAFASAKFGVRALCQSLSRDLGPKNIHVFHVVIDGMVHLPSTTGIPAGRLLEPDDIADTYWFLANQPKNCWSYEVNVGAAEASGDMLTI